MKYVILIGDGMSDEPVAALGNKTPLEYAKTPAMDSVAREGTLGLFKSVPKGYPPGSDVANLSILGYDPKKFYTGRAPLEAASMGIELKPTDVAYRCNLVSLSGKPGSYVMDDYSAGHITTEEAARVIETLDKELSSEGVRFHPGKSYRHLMVMDKGGDGIEATPPHDISDTEISPHLPRGEGSVKLIALMERSQEILKDHPVNKERSGAGKKTADSIWLWGQGRAPNPRMPTFKERYDIDGSIISAVDLLNGIGVCAGLDVIDVPGATGDLDTNFKGKAEYALKSLKDKDFVCVHVEAPDEAGHQGLVKEKVKAIEDFDSLVVANVLKGLRALGPDCPYRLMVITDHPTPVELKTHTSDPVPFAISSKGEDASGGVFTEAAAKETGLVIDDPDRLMSGFLSL